MDENQIGETREFLIKHKSSWNHIMVSAEEAFNAVSDCLIGKMDKPWSLHLSIPFDGSNNDNNGENLQCLRHLNLECLQIDLSLSNPLWIYCLKYLNYNLLLDHALTKLKLPRYFFTQEIKNSRVYNVFFEFMNGNTLSSKSETYDHRQQRLKSLRSLSIEMDHDFLPSEQQRANNFVFIQSLNFKHPIYQSLHIYFIDRLKVLHAPFDIFINVIYGLFCNQFPFLKNRAKRCHNNHKNNNYSLDQLFLMQTLKFPINIEELTIYPPCLKKEMLLFVHALTFTNCPSLNCLELQNWSIAQIATLCKAIQRLTYIQYEFQLKKKKQKYKRSKSTKKHKRSRSYQNINNSLDIDRIIAEVAGNDFKLEILRKHHALFHHIHIFRMNLSSSSLFANISSTNPWLATNHNNNKHKKGKRKNKIYTIKSIKRLYVDNNEDAESKTNDDDESAENNEIFKKSLKPLLFLGEVLKSQFSHLFEFGLNNYQCLFNSKLFMIQLLNGVSHHKYLRKIELRGIGAKQRHNDTNHNHITSTDLAQVVKKSFIISTNNYDSIDKLLENISMPKGIRIEIMGFMYGNIYNNNGTGILFFDFSAKKGSQRRHSIFSALQTIKRRNDNDTIDTKLEEFEVLLDSLERNWISANLGKTDQYWLWKKQTKKIHRKILNFNAM